MTSEDVKRYWDERGRQYKGSARATMAEMTMREREIKAILPYLKDGDAVLDVGCGNGYSTLIFAEKARLRITGIDFSSEMVNYARENAAAFQKRNSKESGVEFAEGDVLQLGFPS